MEVLAGLITSILSPCPVQRPRTIAYLVAYPTIDLLCISKGILIPISPVASPEVESVYVHKSPSLCFHQSPGDGFYIAVGGGIGQHGWCHIQNILQDKQYDVKIEDHSEKMGMLSIQGPKR